MSYLVPRLRTPQQSYGPPLGVKKGRKCDLATDLTDQRRYKSNKRKCSVAQATGKHLEVFFVCAKVTTGGIHLATDARWIPWAWGLHCESGGYAAALQKSMEFADFEVA